VKKYDKRNQITKRFQMLPDNLIASHNGAHIRQGIIFELNSQLGVVAR
jgi:hypothetical protein